MANPYYDHSTFPTPNSAGSSAAMRTELDLIEQGFDKLPTFSGNASKLIAVNASETALETVTGNVSLPGNLTVAGSTTLGDAAGDSLTIWPSAVTWSSNPTHSGNHTWSGTHTLSAGTANQVQYLDGSKLLTGSAGLTFDGTYLTATFQDTGFTLKDNSDATKVATFELSGITTGQTRAYTLPDISGDLVTLGNLSQTFTGSVNFTNASFTVGATSIAIGNSGLATSLNLGFGSTGSGVTKTVNLGTGGASGSTTNITVGSGVAGSTTSIFFNSGGVTAGQFTGGVFSLSTALAVSSGGTGAATLTGVVKGNGTSAFTAGNVNLTSEVTGTLPVANGGTGAATLTGVVKGNGTSAFTAGNVNLTSEVTGTLPVANGGTGITSFGTGVGTALGQNVTGSGSIVLATNPTIAAATFTGNAQTTPVAVTFSATAMTLNCTLSNVFTTTFTANVATAPTISNPQNGQTINWFITQDGTGNRTMTWPSSFRWPTGAVTTLSTAANSVDLLTATYLSSTGLWYASLLKQFV